MYVPPHFQQSDLPVLHEAMRSAGLVTLVSLGADGLIASHVPMLLDAEAGPYGTLVGHLAKPNPQGRGVAAGVDALAIFLGPDAYITPSWYAAKREHGKVVLTWNYTAIHAYGPLEFFDDKDQLLDVVTRLTNRHEGPRTAPWAVTDAPPDFIQAHLKGIVGFRLAVTRLDAKWKMSQNRPIADRTGVADGLRAEGLDEVAALVPET